MQPQGCSPWSRGVRCSQGRARDARWGRLQSGALAPGSRHRLSQRLFPKNAEPEPALSGGIGRQLITSFSRESWCKAPPPAPGGKPGGIHYVTVFVFRRTLYFYLKEMREKKPSHVYWVCNHGGGRKAAGFPAKAPKQAPGRWILCWTAAMHAEEVDSPAVPSLSLLVAPRWPQGQSHCGRVPQHWRVSCSAAGWAHIHCQDSHEPNTMFCKLIWLYLEQTEFQPLAVISQQFAGTPQPSLPRAPAPPRRRSPVIPHHLHSLQAPADLQGETRRVCAAQLVHRVFVLLCEFTCPDFMPEAGGSPRANT